MKTPPKKTKAADFSYSAIYSPDGGVTQYAVVTRTLPELHDAWVVLSRGRILLNESKVQRVSVQPMAFPPREAVSKEP